MKKINLTKSIFCHAIIMVRRNLRSYAMLSVTIILSFSLLLGYLTYTDSTQYNRYKEIFAADRGMIVQRDTYFENSKLEVFLERAADIGNTQSIYYNNAVLCISKEDLYLPEYEKPLASALTGSVYNLPKHAFAFCHLSARPSEITWLDGKMHDEISLEPGEVIIEDDLFYALELDQMDEPTYTFYFSGWDSGSVLSYPSKIVGIVDCMDQYVIEEYSDSVLLQGNPVILLSDDSFSREYFEEDSFIIWERTIVMYTQSPEEVDALAKQLNFTGGLYSNCQEQNEALERIRSANQTKAIITATLLLLLGINLYSSFSNALNDRKFEIGVKRAVGASAWAIVRQFLYESVIVMATNTLLSIALVTDIFLVVKWYQENIGYWNTWTIYCSAFSVGMFVTCAIALTVVFSLIFAYKSTQVQVVDYLKAE